jgi:hypothetical protein
MSELARNPSLDWDRDLVARGFINPANDAWNEVYQPVPELEGSQANCNCLPNRLSVGPHDAAREPLHLWPIVFLLKFRVCFA